MPEPITRATPCVRDPPCKVSHHIHGIRDNQEKRIRCMLQNRWNHFSEYVFISLEKLPSSLPWFLPTPAPTMTTLPAIEVMIFTGSHPDTICKRHGHGSICLTSLRSRFLSTRTISVLYTLHHHCVCTRGPDKSPDPTIPTFILFHLSQIPHQEELGTKVWRRFLQKQLLTLHQNQIS